MPKRANPESPALRCSVSTDLAIIYDKLHGLQSVDMPEDVLALVEQATDTVQSAMYRATDYDHGWNLLGGCE